MSQYQNTQSFRGILRNTDRNTHSSTQGSFPAFGSDQAYSHERNASYPSGNAADMPIYSDDEVSILPTSTFQSAAKPQSINAELYAQAMAAKSNLGLLDNITHSSSALESLRSYGSYAQSPLSSPGSKQNVNTHSQLSDSSFRQGSVDQATFSTYLQHETLSPYNRDKGIRTPDLPAEQSISFKPLTDLNLNSIEDEDEFLYGDSNTLSPSSSEKHSQKETRGPHWNDDELPDVELSSLSKPQSSISSSKSKIPKVDEKSPGIKLNIGAWKKAPVWNYSDDSVTDIKSLKPGTKEHFSKQSKKAAETLTDNPCQRNEKGYETHKSLHYNAPSKSKQNSLFEASKESSKTKQAESSTLLAKFVPRATKKDYSSPKQPAHLSPEKSSKYIAAANLLRKQLNLDGPTKKNLTPSEKSQTKNNVPAEVERNRTVTDKSLSAEGLKLPKLLINVKQGDKMTTKRVVHVKDSGFPSNKYELCSSRKSGSPLVSPYSTDGIRDSSLADDDYEDEIMKTHRVVRNKTKENVEIIKISSSEEARVLPKRYMDKEHQKLEEAHMKQRHGEKIPHTSFEDKYHYTRRGMDSVEMNSEYDSKMRNRRHWSPEKRRSPTHSPRHRSPESSRRKSPESSRRKSPESSRRRSPDYSPSNRHSRDRSPSNRYHDRSPSYRSRYDTVSFRAHDHSPKYRSRVSPKRWSPSHSSRYQYRSRGRSPKHPSPEKSYRSPWDSSSHRYPNVEKRKHSPDQSPPVERTVRKRLHDSSSDDLSEEDQWRPPAKKPEVPLKDTENLKDPIGTLKGTVSKTSGPISSITEKTSIQNDGTEKVPKKASYSDAVTKIIQSLGVNKSISDAPTSTQSMDKPDSLQVSTEAKVATRSQIMNSLLDKLGVPTHSANPPAGVANLDSTPTTSWTTGPTVVQPPAPVLPQLNPSNMPHYGMHYQQHPPTVPHMYSPYPYSAPPVPPLPSGQPPYPYSLYPPPASTSHYSYPPTLPQPAQSTSTINTVDFQNITKLQNIGRKSRIRSLTSVPVQPLYNATQLTDKQQLTGNNVQVAVASAPEISSAKQSFTFKNSVPERQQVTTEDEQQLIERYKKLSEEKGMMRKKLKNTSDQMVELRSLKAELERKTKTSRTAVEKQLLTNCASLYDKANEELKQFIDEAKQLSGEMVQLEKKIKPEVIQKLGDTPEKPEEKEPEVASVVYASYDTGGHWCTSCNQQFHSIPRLVEHLHQESHIKVVDPWKVANAHEVPKESTDKNVKLLPVKGVEFMNPLFAFYCSLCQECLLTHAHAEQHLKGNKHAVNYLSFAKENPIYERKRDLFKRAGMAALANQKRQKDIEDILLAKRLIKEKNSTPTIKRVRSEADSNKAQDALRRVQDKLQDQKNKEKQVEELDESNTCKQNSPKNQKSTEIKLTLMNEKSKEPEVKPKQTVVYIGRAPNYRPKTGDKKSFLARKKFIPVDTKHSPKIICGLDDDKESPESDYTKTTSADESKVLHSRPSAVELAHLNSGFETSPENQTIDNSNNKPGSTQSNEDLSEPSDSDRKTVESRKNKPVLFGCESETEANKKKADTSLKSKKKGDTASESKKNPDSTVESIKKTDTALEPIKKQDTALESKKKPDDNFEPKTNDPQVNQALKNILRKSRSGGQVETNVSLSEIKLPESPLRTSSSDKISTSPNSSAASRRQHPLTEEEQDFLLLGICKSDMEPIAVPKPPPSALIHSPSALTQSPSALTQSPSALIQSPSHSDSSAKLPPFPPPLSVPPPNIVTNVPPPNIVSQVPPPNIVVPPPNIVSQVPPPNIASQVPPPAIALSVPPPNLRLQWSSSTPPGTPPRLKMQSSSIFCPHSQTRTFMAPKNIGVEDMEIDPDIIWSDIKVGPVTAIERKRTSIGNKSVAAPTSDPSCRKEDNEAEIQTDGSSLAESNKTDSFESSPSETDSSVDDRAMLSEFLSCMMDTVTSQVVEKSDGNKSKSGVGSEVISSDETVKLAHSSENILICSSNFENTGMELVLPSPENDAENLINSESKAVEVVEECAVDSLELHNSTQRVSESSTNSSNDNSHTVNEKIENKGDVNKLELSLLGDTTSCDDTALHKHRSADAIKENSNNTIVSGILNTSDPSCDDTCDNAAELKSFTDESEKSIENLEIDSKSHVKEFNKSDLSYDDACENAAELKSLTNENKESIKTDEKEFNKNDLSYDEACENEAELKSLTNEDKESIETHEKEFDKNDLTCDDTCENAAELKSLTDENEESIENHEIGIETHEKEFNINDLSCNDACENAVELKSLTDENKKSIENHEIGIETHEKKFTKSDLSCDDACEYTAEFKSLTDETKKPIEIHEIGIETHKKEFNKSDLSCDDACENAAELKSLTDENEKSIENLLIDSKIYEMEGFNISDLSCDDACKNVAKLELLTDENSVKKHKIDSKTHEKEGFILNKVLKITYPNLLNEEQNIVIQKMEVDEAIENKEKECLSSNLVSGIVEMLGVSGSSSLEGKKNEDFEKQNLCSENSSNKESVTPCEEIMDFESIDKKSEEQEKSVLVLTHEKAEFDMSDISCDDACANVSESKSLTDENEKSVEKLKIDSKTHKKEGFIHNEVQKTLYPNLLNEEQNLDVQEMEVDEAIENKENECLSSNLVSGIVEVLGVSGSSSLEGKKNEDFEKQNLCSENSSNKESVTPCEEIMDFESIDKKSEEQEKSVLVLTHEKAEFDMSDISCDDACENASESKSLTDVNEKSIEKLKIDSKTHKKEGFIHNEVQETSYPNLLNEEQNLIIQEMEVDEAIENKEKECLSSNLVSGIIEILGVSGSSNPERGKNEDFEKQDSCSENSSNKKSVTTCEEIMDFESIDKKREKQEKSVLVFDELSCCVNKDEISSSHIKNSETLSENLEGKLDNELNVEERGKTDATSEPKENEKTFLNDNSDGTQNLQGEQGGSVENTVSSGEKNGNISNVGESSLRHANRASEDIDESAVDGRDLLNLPEENVSLGEEPVDLVGNGQEIEDVKTLMQSVVTSLDNVNFSPGQDLTTKFSIKCISETLSSQESLVDKVPCIQNINYQDSDFEYYRNELSPAHSSDEEEEVTTSLPVEVDIRDMIRQRIIDGTFFPVVKPEIVEVIDLEEEETRSTMPEASESRLSIQVIKTEIKQEDDIEISDTSYKEGTAVPVSTTEEYKQIEIKQEIEENQDFGVTRIKQELVDSVSLEEDSQSQHGGTFYMPVLSATKIEPDDVFSNNSADKAPVLKKHDESASEHFNKEGTEPGVVVKMEVIDEVEVIDIEPDVIVKKEKPETSAAATSEPGAITKKDIPKEIEVIFIDDDSEEVKQDSDTDEYETVE